MTFIADPTEFRNELDHIQRALFRERRLPQQVFRQAPAATCFWNFSALLSDRFFGPLSELSRQTGEDCFWLASLLPDPETYFFRHFRKYPFIRISGDESQGDYVAAINEDPGGSPADAIGHRSDVVVIYPRSLRWVMYGDREWDLSITGILVPEIVPIFNRLFHDCTFFSAENVIEHLAGWIGAAFDEKAFVQSYGLSEFVSWWPATFDPRALARVRVVALLKGLLEGAVSLIEVTRELSRYTDRLDPEIRTALSVFEFVDRFSIGVPVGPIRRYWSAEALRREDGRIAELEDAWLGPAKEAAAKAIRMLDPAGKGTE